MRLILCPLKSLMKCQERSDNFLQSVAFRMKYPVPPNTRKVAADIGAHSIHSFSTKNPSANFQLIFRKKIHIKVQSIESPFSCSLS